MRDVIILGATKTGTSTLVAMLNCHPEIYIAYEVFNNNSKRNAFETYHRNIKIPPTNDIYKFYKLFFHNIRIEKNYEMVGDKIAINRESMSSNDVALLINKLNDLRYSVIFSVRNIRTWLVKQKLYGQNISEDACNYVGLLINSFKLKRRHQVLMMDLFNPDIITSDIASFLGIDSSYINNWWEKHNDITDSFKQEQWYKGHASALKTPIDQDIEVSLIKNDFWEELLPIHDKYFNALNTDFPDKELDEDLVKINKIRVKYNNVMFEDCFRFPTNILNLPQEQYIFSNPRKIQRIGLGNLIGKHQKSRLLLIGPWSSENIITEEFCNNFDVVVAVGIAGLKYKHLVDYHICPFKDSFEFIKYCFKNEDYMARDIIKIFHRKVVDYIDITQSNIYRINLCDFKGNYHPQMYSFDKRNGLVIGKVGSVGMYLGTNILPSLHFSCILGASEVHMIGVDLSCKKMLCDDKKYQTKRKRDPIIDLGDSETTLFLQESAAEIDKFIEKASQFGIVFFDYSGGILKEPTKIK